MSRPLGAPPAVAAIGIGPPVDGGTVTIPVNPALALADLDLFDGEQQTLFPMSRAAFPAESLESARAARARAWLARIPASGSGLLVDRVLRAEVEAAAGDDAVAQRTIAAALAATPSSAGRSYVLTRAVAMFVDPERDDSVLARRAVIADEYLARLEALPAAGYPTVRDSVAVLNRTYKSARDVLRMYCRLGVAGAVQGRTARALRVLRRFGGDDRHRRFGDIPWDAVATIVLGQRHGRVQLDSLKARVSATVALMPTEIAALPAAERAQRVEHVRDETKGMMAAADSLGHSAPPIAAHAWLNTSDSSYATTPRTHSFDDGIIRVLARVGGSCREGCLEAAVLDRVHQRLAAGGVEALLIANTEGYAGTALVEPAEEVGWLTSLFVGRAHLTLPIALWAGMKEPAKFGGRLPEPWPLRTYPWPGDGKVVVVDGHGIIRGYVEAWSHRGEAELERATTYLQAEAAGTAAAVPRPPQLVPALMVGPHQ